MMDVIFDRGTFLPDCDLWLDPRGTRPFSFVSHAHNDHTGHHQRTILTDATARFMRARLGSSGKVQHILRYGEERDFGSFKATLLPAGHVLGSAQILIEKEGERLLYTGNFKLHPGLSSDPAQSVRADTLIMETTFAYPNLLFPPAAKTIERIHSFCREALVEGEVPVLLGYSFGKAQEVLSAFKGAGLSLMLHGSIWQMTQIYEGLGVDFPTYVRFEPERVEGHVVICPPATAGSAMLEKIPKKRVAMITGWGINEWVIQRYQCDEVFSLSDYADYNELLEMVDLVKPSRVYTLHGFADEFAINPRRRGIESWSLTGGNQIEFPI